MRQTMVTRSLVLLSVIVEISCTNTVNRQIPASNVISSHRASIAGSNHVAVGASEGILYAFTGSPDGSFPGPLLQDRGGALFLSTASGGIAGCGFLMRGCGTVTELQPEPSGYTESVLYRFAGVPDGSGPVGSLLSYQGSLFGATASGGTGQCGVGGPGCGTVFRLQKSGKVYNESVIYSFQLGEPLLPSSGVLADKNGSLYGTAGYGGKNYYGAVYELTPTTDRAGHITYQLIDLHDFGGSVSDGKYPYGNLLLASDGSLYGTTRNGGTFGGNGTVYRITPSHGYSVIHSFGQGYDGEAPYSGLVQGRDGTMYGTTSAGGANEAGTVYSIRIVGSAFSERVLYSFGDYKSNDATFVQAPLTIGPAGILYGASSQGGRPYGDGTVFSVATNSVIPSPSYFDSILTTFTVSGGYNAYQNGVLLDGHGNLLGSTIYGGNYDSDCADGCGVIYKVPLAQ